MKKLFISRVTIITLIFTTFSAILKEALFGLNDPLLNNFYYPFALLISFISSLIISLWFNKKFKTKEKEIGREEFRRKTLRNALIFMSIGIISFLSMILYYQLKTTNWPLFNTNYPRVLQGTLKSEMIKCAVEKKIPLDEDNDYEIYYQCYSSLTDINLVYEKFYVKSSIIIIRLWLLLLYSFMAIPLCSSIFMLLEYFSNFQSKKPISKRKLDSVPEKKTPKF